MPGTGKYYQEHYVDIQRDHVVKIIQGEKIISSLQIQGKVLCLSFSADLDITSIQEGCITLKVK
jgi:hypothetical protein